MLDLRRLRLLRELHARGTIAAVADALQFTPSAVSQQLGILEREAGVQLLERAGRGVRLTDAALVLVEHTEALLARAERAEADLAAARRPVARRHKEELPLAELADAHWATGHPQMGWEDMTERTCRERGGFAPDIRHRANDANVSLGLAAAGLACALIPDLPLRDRRPG